MHKKRWLLLGLLLLATAGVVVTVLALLPPRPGVTKENFDRIDVGMTRAEVEAIFGGPANGSFRSPGVGHDEGWEDDTGFGSAAVHFDDDNRVVGRSWFGVPDDRTVWQKMLDRLPWRERSRPQYMEIE